MSLEWDDEDGTIFNTAQGGTSMEWDDSEFTLAPQIPARPIERPAPTEPDFFRSFLNTTREEHRERLTEATKSMRETNISQRASSAHSAATEGQEESEQKQKESATKTYFDFLLNKRQQSARERIKELKKYGYKIPEGQAHLSFVNDESEDRRHSGRPVDVERTIRERSQTQRSRHEADVSTLVYEDSSKSSRRRSNVLSQNKSLSSIKSVDFASSGNLDKFQTRRIKPRAFSLPMQEIDLSLPGRSNDRSNITADRIFKTSKDDYNRAYSFPMEKDRSLREPSFLRDITALSGEHAEATSKGELSVILQEGKIDWDGSGKRADISAVLNEDWDKPQDQADGLDKSFVEMLENMKYDPDKGLEYLINDVYYPGAIDDAVNGKIDFNRLAFMVAFNDGDIPKDAPPSDKQPISLAQAFDRRVEKHKGAIKKTTMQSTRGTDLADRPSTATADKDDLSRPTSKSSLAGYLPRKATFTRILNREELVLASTVGIDVSTIVQNKPVNELIKAMNSLQKAEYMNDYDKSAQAAEEAFKRAPPELAESAAIYGAKNFRTIELTKKSATVKRDMAYKPVEVVSYMGITKPMM